MQKRNALLTNLLDSNIHENNIKVFLQKLSEEELLIPFYNNHLIELYTNNNVYYIPLFTDEEQVIGIEYTRLDKVKLDVVIRDIYSSGKYYAININPFTHDFILNKKIISLLQNIFYTKMQIGTYNKRCLSFDSIDIVFVIWYNNNGGSYE